MALLKPVWVVEQPILNGLRSAKRAVKRGLSRVLPPIEGKIHKVVLAGGEPIEESPRTSDILQAETEQLMKLIQLSLRIKRRKNMQVSVRI